MRKSTRALVGLAVIDLALLAGAAWLIAQTKSGAMSTSDPAEAISRITTVFGGAIGLVSGILLVAFFVQRRRGQ